MNIYQRNKKLYNIALCYHGIVEKVEQALTYRTAVEDFKSQINHLRNLGYTFVSPKDFYGWYDGTYVSSNPLATIHFDDGLDSVALVGDWLVAEQIHFGIPIIAKRQKKRLPEKDFMSWAKLREYVDSGYMELMYHTYNGHHVCISQNEDGEIVSAPFLEKPAWNDGGIYVYKDDTDLRMPYDFSIVENAWGFGLFGTDTATGNLIESQIDYTAPKDILMTDLRFWASLHLPNSLGYNCDLEITCNNTKVFQGTYAVTDYGNRSQWKEREFISIHLTTPMQLQAGHRYSFKIKTLNKGNACFRMYVIPDLEGATRLYSNQSGGDFPAGVPWKAKPCMIISDGTGSNFPEATYADYVRKDFENWRTAVNEYLYCNWIPHTNYVPNQFDNKIVIAGTYSNGQTADTKLRYVPAETFTTNTFSLYWGSSTGKWYPCMVDMYLSEVVNGQEVGETFLTRFTPNWADWKEFDITIPDTTFELGKTYSIRFKTVIQSETGMGLLTVTYNRTKPPEPVWGDGGWVFNGTFDHEAWISVVNNEFSDTYPTGWYVDNNNDWQYEYNGLTASGQPRIAFYTKTVQQTPPVFTQLAFPFGAYYDSGEGLAYDSGKMETVHPVLKTIITDNGFTGGWSIFPTRLDKLGKLREPNLRYDNYALPRLMTYGNVANEVIISGIDSYIGNVYDQLVHKEGVSWQISVEYDAVGNSTIANNCFDYVAWDAYFFTAGGTILESSMNWTDIQKSKDRGNKNFLIISNYDPAIEEPNGEITNAVFQNPTPYINKIVEYMQNPVWDGVYLNMEWVFPEDRQSLNTFVKDVCTQVHAVGKQVQMTVPAITGTTYDLLDWVGAYDYAYIIEHVDGMKIMTYTEAVDEEPAQPHAPTEFFKQVYNYVDSVVPPKYRRRIFVGANAFGRIWTKTTALDGTSTISAEYSTYHECMAEAIRLGVPIQYDVNGEGYWQHKSLTQEVTCYMGTPATIKRAVDMALDRGYRGVGIWKADDGDILEHFPRYDSSKKFNRSKGITKLKNFTWQ